MTSILRNEQGQLWLPLRLVWNDNERRPRSPIRVFVGIVFVLTLANIGRNYQPTVLTGGGPISEALNSLLRGLPQAASIVLGVVLATLVVDRQRLTDRGLVLESGIWRRFASGLAIGVGISALSVVVGAVIGYYDVVDVRVTGSPVVWLLLVVITGISQLSIVIAEELLARGYLITNILEGFNGIPTISRNVAASVAIAISSAFFYFTHSSRGEVFGIMAGGLAVLLGVAYVLSEDISLPIGIHFGVNFAGMLVGTAPQPASVVQLVTPRTVAESLLLPREAVAVRLVGATLGIGLVLWWYRASSDQIRGGPRR